VVLLFAVDHHRIRLDATIRGEHYGAVSQTGSGLYSFRDVHFSLFIGDPSHLGISVGITDLQVLDN
jgi:hypothetical protein